jgi:hypothetical protein
VNLIIVWEGAFASLVCFILIIDQWHMGLVKKVVIYQPSCSPASWMVNNENWWMDMNKADLIEWSMATMYELLS